MITHTPQTSSAIKTMGPIIKVDPDTFIKLLQRVENPLVVHAPKSFLTSN